MQTRKPTERGSRLPCKGIREGGAGSPAPIMPRPYGHGYFTRRGNPVKEREKMTIKKYREAEEEI